MGETVEQVQCVYCGMPHDISHIEPAFARPDAVVALSPEERSSWVTEGKDYSVIRPRRSLVAFFTKPSIRPRYFVRVNMPFRVARRSKPVAWGIWAEVSAAKYRRIYDLWDSPDQSRESAITAHLANDISGYPPTSGLPGTLQLQGPTTVPLFTLDHSDHPLVNQQEEGVTEETVLVWLKPILH